MSDRGDDSSAAPAATGTPTGPLPGPRPPVSGWPQPPQSGAYGGSGAPSVPSQATGSIPAGPSQPAPFGSREHSYSAVGQQTGTAFGGGSSHAVSAPPYGSGYPSSSGAPTSAIPQASGPQPSGSQLPGSQLSGAQLSGAPGGPQGPRERRGAGRMLGVVGFGLAVVLLLVVIAQAILLTGVSGDLDDAQAAQDKAEASAAKDREDLANLTKRVQGLEERTEGTLNSTAVAKKVLPSVFSVRAGQSTGTAFAFATAPGGGTLLITNYHVVDSLVSSGGKNATIQRDSESYPVTIDRTDKDKDLAVLRTSAKFSPLKPSQVEVAPGDPVIVVGAPLGLTDTVTTGVVSAVRDDVEGLATRVIQFDAAINPGNSGGPVINADGQVVGIAQAKIIAEGADGLGLAIPINEVCKGLINC